MSKSKQQERRVHGHESRAVLVRSGVGVVAVAVSWNGKVGLAAGVGVVAVAVSWYGKVGWAEWVSCQVACCFGCQCCCCCCYLLWLLFIFFLNWFCVLLLLWLFAMYRTGDVRLAIDAICSFRSLFVVVATAVSRKRCVSRYRANAVCRALYVVVVVVVVLVVVVVVVVLVVVVVVISVFVSFFCVVVVVFIRDHAER